MLTCLCLTYGRFQLLRESLTCFLKQDTRSCQLLIWNFHEVPIKLAEPYPSVTLLNRHHKLNNIDAWMAGLDIVKTKYVKAWLDDDLYAPWAVSQALTHICSHSAFMHRGRYQYRKDTEFVYYDEDPNDGANLTMDVAIAKKTGMDKHAGIKIPDDTVVMPINPHALPSWVLTATEKDDGGWRKSHLLIHLSDPAFRNTVWRSRQTDTGEGLLLTPAPISHHIEIAKKCRPELNQWSN